MKYANENIYIMDVEQIEVLSSTDTADIAYLPKSTISPGGSYKMSGFSASSTVAIAGPGSFIYGHQGSLYSRELDFKRYELKDLPKAFGIGNVRVVISDVKEPNATYDQFTADLKSYYNYYAFGMLQPNRLYTLAEEYKFGFNGQEVEDEISGDNNHLVFTYRIHDARLGRFMSVDPLFSSYPWNSAYSFAENDVIRCIDLEGAERFVVIISENNTGGQTTTTIEVPNENFTKEGILYVHIKNNRVYFYFQSSENVTMVQYSPERIKEKHNKNNYVSPSGHFSDEEIYVGGGGFIVGGQTIEIRTENKATGFYETSVKTKKNLTYPLEIGPSIAWGGSLQINKRVLNKLKTNSLCEVLNYPDRIESKAGGLVYGGGIIKAYKGNDLVYKLKYQGIITGFTFSNALLNDWEPGSMDGQDSLMRSEINLLEGLGNSSDYKSTRNKYKENKDED